MPVYLYRRQDGSTFEYRQKFADAPLAVDPETGQKVARVVQATGVIFKGSGFYVNDSKGASKQSLNGSHNHSNGAADASRSDSAPSDTAKTDAPKAESAAPETTAKAKDSLAAK